MINPFQEENKEHVHLASGAVATGEGGNRSCKLQEDKHCRRNTKYLRYYKESKLENFLTSWEKSNKE